MLKPLTFYVKIHLRDLEVQVKEKTDMKFKLTDQ